MLQRKASSCAHMSALEEGCKVQDGDRDLMLWQTGRTEESKATPSPQLQLTDSAFPNQPRTTDPF